MKRSKLLLDGYLILKIMEKYYKDIKIVCLDRKYSVKITPKSFLVDFSDDYKINGLWVISDSSCSYIDLFERNKKLKYIEEYYLEAAKEDEFKNDEDVKRKVEKIENQYSEVVFKDSKIYININKLLIIEIDNKNIEEFIKFVDNIDCVNNEKEKHNYILNTAKYLKDNNLKRYDYWFKTAHDFINLNVVIDDISIDYEFLKDEAKKYKDEDILKKADPKRVLLGMYKRLPEVVLPKSENDNYDFRRGGKLSEDVKYLFSNIYTNNEITTEIINTDAGFYIKIKNTNIIDQLYKDAITFTSIDEDIELEFSIEKNNFEKILEKDSYYDNYLINREIKSEGNRNFRMKSKNELLDKEYEKNLLKWGYDLNERGYKSDDDSSQILFEEIYKHNEKFIGKLKNLDVYIHNISPESLLTMLKIKKYFIIEDFAIEKDTNFVDYSIVKPNEEKYKIKIPDWYYEEKAEERRLEAQMEADFWDELDEVGRANLINMLED